MIKLEGGSFNSKRILGMFNILNDDREEKMLIWQQNTIIQTDLLM
jgi:hypothetical protein